MILRSAASADVDALLDVQEPGAVEGLGHIFPQDQHPFPREAIGSRWLAEIADPKINVYLYSEHEGTIRGFAAVRDHELLHFGTALDTWGTGLASGFHDALLDATARRTTRPTLMLRVFKENVRARRFYEKHGWQLTGRSSRTTFPPHPLLLEYNRRLTQPSR